MKKVLLVLMLLPISVFAQGGALALEQFKDTFKIEFESPVATFKEACGVELAIDLDHANLSTGTSDEDRRSVGGYCGIPLEQLAIVCQKGENYKKIVTDKIKKFSCSYAGASGTRSLELAADGKLTWVFEYVSEHTQGHADYIQKRLLELL